MPFALLGLVAAALLLSGPIALIVALSQRGRIRRLERELHEAQGGREPVTPEAPSQVGEARPKAAPKPTFLSEQPGGFERVIGGQWLTWIGVLAIFFGTAFFLAFDLRDHPFSGVGQIFTGLLVAAIFGVAGTALSRRTQRFLGRGLLGGSMALLFLAAYAAYGFHRIIPPWAVYPFLVGVAILGTWVALAADSLAIATLTLVGALVTPLLVETGGDPARILFPYVIAVSAGTAWVSVRRTWPLLPLIAFVGAALTALIWWYDHLVFETRGAATIFVTTLWLIYGAVPLLRSAAGRVWGLAYSLLVVANATLMATFLHQILTPRFDDLRGLAIGSLAIVYLVAARVLHGRMESIATHVTYYSGIALAVVAVPIHFDGEWTTLAWITLASLLVWSGVRFRRAGHRWAGLVLMVITLGRLLLSSAIVATSGGDPFPVVFNVDFAVGVLVAAVVASTAVLLLRNRSILSATEGALVTPLLLAAAVALWWHFSAEAIAYFHTRTGFTDPASRLPALLALSWIWALYAAALIASGFIVRFRPIRILGVVVLGILVLKVFLLDMQYLERGYRIASFVGVGVLLLVVSLFYQRERKS